MIPKTCKALLVLALALALGGCSLFNNQSQPAPAPTPTATGGAPTANGKQPAPPQALGRYYDFDDIQVPVQLKLDTKRSLLFRVGSFKCGLLVFEDNLEVESLINYFIESMAKDNWVLKSSFKYPRACLFFAKKGRTAIINIIESTLTTTVEIWVAPTL